MRTSANTGPGYKVSIEELARILNTLAEMAM